MRCNRSLIAVALAAFCCASVAQATLLYEQTFNPPNDPLGYSGAITDSGWSVELFPTGGFSGTYSGNFAPLNMLADAASNQPINGNTGVYLGVGGPTTAALGAFYTIDGAGGFSTFDPATCERCLLTVYVNTQAGGLDDQGYFIVNAGPGGRDPSQWYISATPMDTPTQNQGNLMDWRTLQYNAAPGNWNHLSLGPLTVGGPADLTGLLITGVGVLSSVTNPDGDFSSWNYADYRILCVPEPSAFVLLALAAPALLAMRRQK